MKRRLVAFALMLLALILPTACGLKFELSSLEITPSKVGTGDNATVTVYITNTGAKEGTYAVTLNIDSVPVDTQNVTLPSNSTEKVTFTVVKETVGTYKVGIGKLTGTLEVVRPAEFQLSSLEVATREVILDNPATAMVEVTNVGDLSGNYTCNLFIDGIPVVKKEITLDGGAKDVVGLTFMPGERGVHEIKIGNLTQTIMVMKPADFTLSSLKTSPDIIAPGSNATITVSVTNTGDIKGDDTVVLFFNKKIESQQVTLAGGESKTVSFIVTTQDIGIYNFSVQNVTGYLCVAPPIPDGYKGYTGFQKNYAFIAYPEWWQQQNVDTSSPFNTIMFSFLGPYDGGYIIGSTVYRQSLYYYSTAKEYLSDLLAAAPTYYQGFSVLSTEELTINGVQAARAIYSYSRGTISIKGQVITLKNPKNSYSYSIWLECAQSVYDKNASTFEAIANSFTILPGYSK